MGNLESALELESEHHVPHQSQRASQGGKSFRKSSRSVFRNVSSRRNIFCQNSTPAYRDSLKFKFSIYPKRIGENNFLKDSLTNSFIFDILSQEEQSDILDGFKKETYPPGTTIINQNDVGDYLYVIYSGTVRIAKDGKAVKNIGKGSIFGELALMYDEPRSASCVVGDDEEVIAFKLDRDTFKYIMANASKKELVKAVNVMEKVSFLKGLSEYEKKQISQVLVPNNFKAGDIVVEKFDIGEVFYIVIEGQVRVHDIGFASSKFNDQILREGDFFGERALLTAEPRAANVSALTDCKTMSISRNEFRKIFGDLDKLKLAFRKRVLVTMPFIAEKRLSNEQIEKLSSLLEIKKFDNGVFLTKTGETIENQGLYIIEQGAVLVVEGNGTVREFTKGDHFGQSTIELPEDSISDRTVQFTAKSTCLVLSRASLGRMKLGGSSTFRMGKSLRRISSGSMLEISDLQEYGFLGKGSFGDVALVSLQNKTKTYFAMKRMSKAKIIEMNQVPNVIREKNILASLDHKQIVKLEAARQDEKYIYMLFDFVQGGDLFNLIYSSTNPEYLSGISYETAQFYSACILEALAHLHERHICYRDLKPENVLIDKDGYCVLADFGFAKVVMDKTYTMCGTPEYLAPEVILSRGHDKSVDYWGLGVLIFEIISGYTPFAMDNNDERILYKKIVKGIFEFPQEGFQDSEAPFTRDIVERLLTRNPSKRLGCLAGADNDVKRHGFFQMIDWSKIFFKKEKAPWIPSISSDTDVRYFRRNEDIYKDLIVSQDKSMNHLHVSDSDESDSDSDSDEDENNLTEEEQDVFADFEW